jgi:hypothetical protein
VLADVARDRHDRHIARLRLGQLGNAGDSEIVKPAMEARAPASAAPCRPPSLRWPRGVNLPVLAPRKQIIARLDAGKAPGQRTSASKAGRLSVIRRPAPASVLLRPTVSMRFPVAAVKRIPPGARPRWKAWNSEKQISTCG